MNPPLIFAPTHRHAMRYAMAHHLPPTARTVTSEESVVGWEHPTLVLCLLGDERGTYEVEWKRRIVAERLIDMEQAGLLKLLYRFAQQTPFPSLAEAADLVKAAIPQVERIDFKPPIEMYGFGVVAVSFSDRPGILLPTSTQLWQGAGALLPAGVTSFEFVQALIDDLRDRRHRSGLY